VIVLTGIETRGISLPPRRQDGPLRTRLAAAARVVVHLELGEEGAENRSAPLHCKPKVKVPESAKLLDLLSFLECHRRGLRRLGNSRSEKLLAELCIFCPN
jgi:hypothetical protein